MAGHTLYPGAKSLAIKFSQSLDAELRDKGIKVTAICPGFTLTEFAEANGTKAVMDSANRRLFQTADEVVRIAFAPTNAAGSSSCPACTTRSPPS